MAAKETNMIYYKRLMQIRKIKKMLDAIAYGSLFLDMAVAIGNYISLKSTNRLTQTLDFWLTAGLSLEVGLTLFLLFLLLLLYHYDKLEWFLFTKRSEMRQK
ncbi:MAG: hypothetical protein ACP5T4_00385 [Candidatus Micrarchaeia archaeon]